MAAGRVCPRCGAKGYVPLGVESAPGRAPEVPVFAHMASPLEESAPPASVLALPPWPPTSPPAAGCTPPTSMRVGGTAEEPVCLYLRPGHEAERPIEVYRAVAFQPREHRIVCASARFGGSGRLVVRPGDALRTADGGFVSAWVEVDGWVELESPAFPPRAQP